MPAIAVETPTERYSVLVERGLLRRIGACLPPRQGKRFLLTTRDVWELHGPSLQEGMRDVPHEVLFFVGGEQNKRLTAVENLAEQMVDRGGDRASLVIGLGGGIVTDIAGFLAAAFMRGVPVVQVPTTLLAQVDAALGGKTGVNLRNGKNLFGAFHQPEAVLVDPDVLQTLPEREYRAGLAEVIKAGIIYDPALFELLEQRREAVLALDAAVVERIVADSVRIKAEVVSADEKESGLRRILNYGHTFGHALEAETQYNQVLHGEAVAFGMRAAARLAETIGLCPAAECQRIIELTRSYVPVPALTHLDPESIAARLTADKKTIGGTVHFVLAERIGAVRIVTDAPRAAVLDAIRTALHG